MDNQQYRPTLLDVPISFFEYDPTRNTFANVPARQTTLRRMASTKYYSNVIQAIRIETDKPTQDELKKRLPAFTPAALLRHRKRDTSFEEKIAQQWPVMMGDVDQKDNPSVDMADLKKAIARLPYVLVCAYSVRGGLWFVVHLPDHQTPESLAAHFRHLQKLFSQVFGIVLDSTKGGNPTDLRFVSCDTAPYLNEIARVMKGTYTPPPPKPRPVDPGRFNGQDEGQLLTRLVRFTERAGEGQRHATLLKAAKLAGGFVAAGRMDEQTAVYALETVASEWPTFTKSQKTIRDGIRYGQTVPLYPEARVERTIARQPDYSSRYKPPPVSKPPVAPQPAEPSRTAKIIPDEILVVDPCDSYPAEWDAPASGTLTINASRIAHPTAPLFFDAAEQLRRIRWCVIPPGVEEEDYVPTLTTSPNRDEFARILGIEPDQLPLYQLTRS